MVIGLFCSVQGIQPARKHLNVIAPPIFLRVPLGRSRPEKAAQNVPFTFYDVAPAEVQHRSRDSTVVARAQRGLRERPGA